MGKAQYPEKAGKGTAKTRDLDDYQEQYSNYPFERFLVKYRKSKVIAQINKYPHKKILDVGCGLDPLFRDFDDFDEMVVLEPAQKFFDKAIEMKNNSKLESSVKIIKSTFEDFNFKPNDFDIILLSSLLHELPDPEGFLRLASGRIGKKTIIHINTPNARSFHRLLAVEMGLIKNEYEKSKSQIRFQRKFVFSSKDIERLAKGSNLEIVEMGTYAFKPFTHEQLLQMLKSSIINEDAVEALFRMDKFAPELGSEIFADLKRK